MSRARRSGPGPCYNVAMGVPRLLTGTLLGALVGAIVINPCNGGAATGAVIGVFCWLLVGLGVIKAY